MRTRLLLPLAAATAVLGLATVPAQAAPAAAVRPAAVPTQCGFSSHTDAGYAYWIDATCSGTPGQSWKLALECQLFSKPIVIWRYGNVVSGTGTSSATCGPLSFAGPAWPYRILAA